MNIGCRSICSKVLIVVALTSVPSSFRYVFESVFRRDAKKERLKNRSLYPLGESWYAVGSADNPHLKFRKQQCDGKQKRFVVDKKRAAKKPLFVPPGGIVVCRRLGRQPSF